MIYYGITTSNCESLRSNTLYKLRRKISGYYIEDEQLDSSNFELLVRADDIHLINSMGNIYIAYQNEDGYKEVLTNEKLGAEIISRVYNFSYIRENVSFGRISDYGPFNTCVCGSKTLQKYCEACTKEKMIKCDNCKEDFVPHEKNKHTIEFRGEQKTF